MADIDFKAVATRWKKYADNYSNEGRKLYLSVIKSCSTVSAALLGFNVIWLQINNHPNRAEKYTFLVSIFCLGGALIFGILAQKSITKYINGAASYYENKSSALNTYMLNTGKVAGRVYPEEVEKLTFNFNFRAWEERAQLLLLSMGIVLSVCLAYLFVK